jgi:hypothetical protein
LLPLLETRRDLVDDERASGCNIRRLERTLRMNVAPDAQQCEPCA